MGGSRLSVGGASCKLARTTSTMLLHTDTTCYCTSGTAFFLAHFLAATAVLAAPASGFGGGGTLTSRSFW